MSHDSYAYDDERYYEEYEPMEPYAVIEPMTGETYREDGYAAYRYSEYEQSSVLAGQVRRSFLGGPYATVDEARAAHPDAEVSEGSGYVPPVDSGPWPGFDPADAGESWE